MEPAELRVSDIPEPEAGPGALQVEVRAAGCNFFDTLIVQGKYQVKPDFPFTPGGEISGVVKNVGEGVEGFAVGDRILAGLQVGGFAETAVVPASLAHRLPEGMSFEEGAAIPIIYPTSYAALIFRANLQAGETLLVHAAVGGVGSAAVQIGKALGARVIATVGGGEKAEIARDLGADEVIDYRVDDFVARVNEITDGNGADVIYDPVGGDVFDGSLKCIAWNGRLIVVGFAGGRIPEVKANRILLKNIAVTGVHWGAYLFKEPARVPETFEGIFSLYRDGKIKPLIYNSYALEDLPSALAELASRKTHGKLIITP
ncbi:MAG: NADPH:quinone oxidoreductase family protein [Deltaproteobacteria bacterium]|nr:NADPH:quinone oxidoreductase family protein [Deltaproteobacteria bacterium]